MKLRRLATSRLKTSRLKTFGLKTFGLKTSGLKTSGLKTHLASFLCGAALVFGLTTLSQSKAAGPAHVYELRVYHAAPGKLDALKARFGDHTDALFARHNMRSLGYWVPQENPDNMFVYILEHPSRAEADANWAAFRQDPEWTKVKAESEKDGVLTTKTESTFITPLPFSKLQ